MDSEEHRGEGARCGSAHCGVDVLTGHAERIARGAQHTELLCGEELREERRHEVPRVVALVDDDEPAPVAQRAAEVLWRGDQNGV